MNETQLLDGFPLWRLFLATVAIVALSVEAGFRLGRYRRQGSDAEKEAPVGAIAGRRSACWHSCLRSRSVWRPSGSTPAEKLC